MDGMSRPLLGLYSTVLRGRVCSGKQLVTLWCVWYDEEAASVMLPHKSREL